MSLSAEGPGAACIKRGPTLKMKTNYRVFLIIAVFGTALIRAAVMPHAVGARAALNEIPDDKLFAGLRWRNIGPFHGGRVSAVTGAPGQPGTFYLGAPAGGARGTQRGGGAWGPRFG